MSPHRILSTVGRIGMSVHACRDNKRVFASLHARNLQRIAVSPFRRESFLGTRRARFLDEFKRASPEVTSIGGNVSCNIRSRSASCPTPYVYSILRPAATRRYIHNRITALAAASFGCDIGVTVSHKKKKEKKKAPRDSSILLSAAI